MYTKLERTVPILNDFDNGSRENWSYKLQHVSPPDSAEWLPDSGRAKQGGGGELRRLIQNLAVVSNFFREREAREKE